MTILADRDKWSWALLLGILALISAIARPLLPIDETRYLSVAWEMWTHHQFLVPTLNGLPYSHKPPLLFWLIHAGWSVLGVSTLWPRLLPALFSFGSLLLTCQLAKTLWPTQPDIGPRASWLLVGCFSWMIYSTTVLFDLFLIFFLLFTLIQLIRYHRQPSLRSALLISLGVSLGLLSKGPVLFLFLLPTIFLLKNYRLLMFLVVGILFTLLWAIPAAHAGGSAYQQAIFLGQSVHRLGGQAPHYHTFWWYLWLAPCLYLPWSVWPPVWQGFRTVVTLSEEGIRLLRTTVLTAFVCFSCIGGKQPHYLLPLLPLISLLLAKAWAEAPPSSQESENAGYLSGILFLLLIGALATVLLLGGLRVDWHIVVLFPLVLLPWFCRSSQLSQQILFYSIVNWIFFMGLLVGPGHLMSQRYEATEVAYFLKIAEDHHIPIAYLGDYQGEFHFLGRLVSPITSLSEEMLSSWISLHPNGIVIASSSDPLLKRRLGKAILQQPFRGKILSVYEVLPNSNRKLLPTSDI